MEIVDAVEPPDEVVKNGVCPVVPDEFELTVMVAPVPALVTGLPKESSAVATNGPMPADAFTVWLPEGTVVKTSLLAVVAPTLKVFEFGAVTLAVVSLALSVYEPAVSKVTPLKVAMPEDSAVVIVVLELFEKVVWADPETMLRATASDEFATVFPYWSLAVAVTLNPVPAVCGVETAPMARVLTVAEAATLKELEFTGLVTPLIPLGVAVKV
jgi:hypothetical protein